MIDTIAIKIQILILKKVHFFYIKLKLLNYHLIHLIHPIRQWFSNLY